MAGIIATVETDKCLLGLDPSNLQWVRKKIHRKNVRL